MAKYNRFDNILDACLEDLLTGKGTVEQCLQKYPGQAEALEPLLRTALSVRRTVEIKPTPEMIAHGRYHLQLKMAETGKPKHGRFLSWQPRWAVAVMAVLLVFLMGSGAVLAANGSMPGNPLYPVKIATENLRVKLSGSEVEKAALLTTYADRRVKELLNVLASDKPDPEKVEAIAARYNDHLVKASAITRDEQTVAGKALMMTATAETTPSTELAAPAAVPAITATPKVSQGGTKAPAAEAFTQDREAAPQLAATRAEDDGEKDKLRKLLIYYGDLHPQELEKLLESDKVPEKAKPAIRRMIQDAKSASKQAQKDLESRRESK
ncbi:MAG: DUF5667 domain-containing protein [Dehalococcoidia bacterium]|nr:DUF5667 domain-containing protein [Dehalococcoidia bacterium]